MDYQSVQQFSLARALCAQFPDCNKYFVKYVQDPDDDETVESFNQKMLNIIKLNKSVQYGIKVDN